MTYAQLSLTIMGIIAYVSVWLSVGVFICWVWFGEGKGDILVLMCYILHNSAVICGDFDIDIKDNPNAAHPSLPSMDQIIEEPTYFAGGTYTSLLDHIYIQNCTIFMSGVLDTYYSDHDAIFADIALHGYQQWVPQLTRSGLKGDLYVIFRH